jgi:hypothetical protein
MKKETTGYTKTGQAGWCSDDTFVREVPDQILISAGLLAIMADVSHDSPQALPAKAKG